MLRGFLTMMLVARLAVHVDAAMLGTGNILVADYDLATVTEYTTAGVFVQSFTVPPTGEGASYHLRDIIVDGDGNIHAYNGTFDAELATVNTVTSGVTTQTLSGLSTSNTLSDGGIAVLNDSVFLTDEFTYNGGEEQGIVKFSTTGDPAVRFATDNEYQDLTIGIDGYLYALRDNDVGIVDVFDPLTNALIRTIDLDGTLFSATIRGISVDADGTLYLIGLDDNIYSADSDGNVIASIGTGSIDPLDINVDNAGNLVVGSRFGDVILSDTSLSSVTSFTIASENTVNVSFTDPLQIQSQAVPEPGSLVLLGLTTCGLGFAARRRRRQSDRRC